MALLAWHKLDYVIPGRPFGDGRDGDGVLSSTADQSLTAISGSGTNNAGQANVGVAANSLANGDIVIIHQSRGGANVGKWMFNKIVSGGGTTTLTMAKNLAYQFVDSGASQFQVIKVPLYKNLTVNTGVTISAPAWNANVNGFAILVARKVLTLAGSSRINMDSRGYRGGNLSVSGGTAGEGTADDMKLQGTANGTGGGGGKATGSGGGGGGGHASDGTEGWSSNKGDKGLAGGSADLVTMIFGGAGGQAWENPQRARGGNSAGICIMIASDIQLSNDANERVTLRGENGTGQTPSNYGAGAGSGGACLIQCKTGTFGANKIIAPGGAGFNGGNASRAGGNGSVGRIAIYHSGTISGTTNPTFTDTTDPSLKEKGGGGAFFQMF